ncbi:unnamed protein product, partial [Heterosigma akashiwo]
RSSTTTSTTWRPASWSTGAPGWPTAPASSARRSPPSSTTASRTAPWGTCWTTSTGT